MTDSLRRTVHTDTTKFERHHTFAKHLAFGGNGLFKTNVPTYQEQAIVYNELVANAVALHTVVDQTQALHALKSNAFEKLLADVESDRLVAERMHIGERRGSATLGVICVLK